VSVFVAPTPKSFGEMPESFVKRVDGFAALPLFLKSFGETCCRDMQSLANVIEDLLQIAVEGLRRDVQSLAIPSRSCFTLQFCRRASGRPAVQTPSSSPPYNGIAFSLKAR
jgi:hypothetical protein